MDNKTKLSRPSHTARLADLNHQILAAADDFDRFDREVFLDLAAGVVPDQGLVSGRNSARERLAILLSKSRILRGDDIPVDHDPPPHCGPDERAERAPPVAARKTRAGIIQAA